MDGYHINHKYEDPEKNFKSKIGNRVKSHKTLIKKQNYLDEETNKTKDIPGPGTYKIEGNWPKQTRQVHHSEKKTYIDELMRRK